MSKNILVVDDEKDILDLISYNLEKEGFEVHYLSVDKYGLINVDELQKSIGKIGSGTLSGYV